jgi:transcriptional regulator with XRE-family HTH domain
MTTTTWQDTPAGKAFLLRHGKKKKVRITWLARARILSGQSVAQAAKACGLNARTWANWEQGRRFPDGSVAGVLVERYGYPAFSFEMLFSKRRVRVSPATLEVLGE